MSDHDQAELERYTYRGMAVHQLSRVNGGSVRWEELPLEIQFIGPNLTACWFEPIEDEL